MNYIQKLLQGADPSASLRTGVEWKTVDTVFTIIAGGDVPKDAFSEVETLEFNIPILSNGIDEKALYGWTDKAKIEKPSLTISARGTIGWTSYREKPFFPIVRLIVLTPKVEMILKYAYYYMKIIENNYKVPPAGIPQLTKPMIKDIQLPIPPLPVQQEIVRILDTFTELTAALTVELTARKKQYSFYREALLMPVMVNGKWLMNNKEVEWKTLGEVVEMKAGKHISSDKINPIETLEYQYPCFGGNGIRGYINMKSNAGNHLLIGRQGALCGNVQRIDGEFYATEHAVVVTSNGEINIDFAFHLLTLMNLNQYASKSAQPGLAVGKLETLKIPIPPLAEQERIVSILDKMDTLTTSISEGLPKEIELRKKQYEYYRDKLLTFPKTP